MSASQHKSNFPDTFGTLQTDAIEKIFEPQLKRLNIGREQIAEQSLDQLYQSLEVVSDAMKHPESFGTVRLKITAQSSIIVTTSHTESHLEVGILPLLIERKQQINERITYLGGKLNADHKQGRQTITIKPIFSPVDDSARFQSDIFVIMPFAKQFEAVYTDVIKPTGEELGLTVKRGDDFFSHHNVMDEIWFAIYSCNFVIADCTGRNPNVYYELGIAHTLGKQYILLTQDVDDVPFDIRGRRFIVYEDKLSGQHTLKKQLADALKALQR